MHERSFGQRIRKRNLLKGSTSNHLLLPWAGALNGSLAYPLFLLILWIGIMVPLSRKKYLSKSET